MKTLNNYLNLIKRLGLILIASGIIFTACSGQTNKKSNIITKNVNKMKTVHLTTSEFLAKVANYEQSPNEWKYLGDKPAIVDFYADWCGPCKALAPTMENLAEEYDGKLYIYKVNVDEEESLAAEFGIQSIPTLLFIPMKGKPQITQGVLPKSEIKKIIDDSLLK